MNDVCAVEGCNRDRRNGSPYCVMHTARLRKKGSLGPGATLVTPRTGPCIVNGCGRGPVIARGLCRTHYRRWQRLGSFDLPVRIPKPVAVCSVEGCEKPSVGRGWCDNHWHNWRRNGKPEPLTTADRFWMKVDKSDPGGCWLWTSTRTKAGYATFWTGERLVTAYRYGYELVIGPIPPGMHLDHLCNNGRGGCVRPDHVEPVAPAENRRRQKERLSK